MTTTVAPDTCSKVGRRKGVEKSYQTTDLVRDKKTTKDESETKRNVMTIPLPSAHLNKKEAPPVLKNRIGP